MITLPKRSKTEAFIRRMQAEGLPSLFIETFSTYYEQLVSGHTGLIPESDIDSVDSLPDADSFSDYYREVGETALAQTAVIKLNGGLGTSMGLQNAKSLLCIKNNLTFLDIIAGQVGNADIPLVLMNSFNTDSDSLQVLNKHRHLHQQNVPLRFLQHKEPKVRQKDFAPAEWPDNPELAWCPPGHGDIYTAMITSGTLDALLDAGYKYAFVSNVDNLGAVIDLHILGFFADHQYPFMMEVADRTAMDKKGGHLAQRLDGQLILRESAQCPDEDTAAFQDIERHKFFNTNNLWLHLPTLKKVMMQRDYQLGLPMIRNAKTVDPRDPDSTAVYQIETAMGSAIGVFSGAQAIRVPRTRFAPVKTTNDLLTVRSDVYDLTADHFVTPIDAAQARRLEVSLDDRYYKFVSDLEAHFRHGAPSLQQCSSLTVEGDVAFGADVVCRGDVRLVNTMDEQVFIADGTILEGTTIF